MPITSGIRRDLPPKNGHGSCGCASSCASCGCHSTFGKKMLFTLLGVLMVYGIFYFGTLINNNLKKNQFIGRMDKSERMVTVNGLGKVTGNNNIAVTTIGYSNTDKEVSKAQLDNKKIMDQVMADLKKLGIEDKDLQTDYTIYPDYNYTQERGQELKGYRVNNSVTVKIRDLSKINDILGLAGKYGATEVGGLSFTIDDPSNLKDQARGKALDDAKKKAAELAASLGVRLGGVVSYNEYDASNDTYYPKYNTISAEGGGMGSGAPEAVSGGSKDVLMNVNITYEILP
ncbi:MAG: SIMPL domain-containing protein [Candidatus Magasanikbacteria bacterium]|nr:SIMPL domain-containing protein [Candidatus Magasanikbacteria bacterium]